MEELAPTPLTVIGAGPAGIMAASTAAEAGVPVTLIDDNSLPGGQYFRQSPPEFSIASNASAHSGHPDAAAYYARLEHPRIRTLYNRYAWGVFEKRVLALADQTRTYALPVDRVIIATGAYDRPLAFPGWTLPGVQGAGATLRMVKTQWLRPGRRVLLAGLGPLQLSLADALLHADVEIVCVAEASDPFAARRALTGLWGHWNRMREAATYLRTLRRRRVPYLVQHAIIAATGDEQVTGASIARLDAAGVPIPGSERHFEVDAICLGYGLLPSFQLAAAFGCELRFDTSLHWWTPVHDDRMQTTEPGIFVAGDVTDIAGAEVAALEGQAAGQTAAHQLGYLDAVSLRSRLAPLMAKLRRLGRFTATLNHMYAFPDGLAFLARDDTTLCRCEEVKMQEVKRAIEIGGTDLHQLKLRTRAGMGYCQGRNCSALIAPIIAKETGQPLSTLRPFTVRPPLQPIPLEVLASGATALESD
jgi:D-hydroxyproline dehydrogenase subunit alpha